MSLGESHGECGGEICNNEFACDVMCGRGLLRECSELGNVIASVDANKWPLQLAHSCVLEVRQFTAVAHQLQHACEDGLGQREWKVVEWQAADHKVISAVERGRLDGCAMQFDRHARVTRAEWLQEASLEVLTKNRIHFDEIECVVSAKRSKDGFREWASARTDLQNLFLAAMFAQ